MGGAFPGGRFAEGFVVALGDIRGLLDASGMVREASCKPPGRLASTTMLSNQNLETCYKCQPTPEQ